MAILSESGDQIALGFELFRFAKLNSLKLESLDLFRFF